jgi:hypothetical protein
MTLPRKHLVALTALAFLIGCDRSPQSGSKTAATSPSQPAPPVQPSSQVAATPSGDNAPGIAAGPESPKLRFLKTVGKPVWDRLDRRQWLVSNPNLRLVGQEPATRFMEYAGGDKLAKTHAAFLSDHMSLLELTVIRGGKAAADREVSRFEEALGPADVDSIPDHLPEQERGGTITFRQWDVRESGRHLAVRCMVRTGETNGGTPVFYFQQTFVDMDAAETATGQ